MNDILHEKLYIMYILVRAIGEQYFYLSKIICSRSDCNWQ